MKFNHVGIPTTGPFEGEITLLYRKAAAFDFTVLGPRVPAVVVSSRIPAGTVDAQTHDHASIPATLRSLFAPGAQPLTGRDRWSAPFHELCTLPEARTGLPALGLALALAFAFAFPPAPALARSREPAPGADDERGS